MRCPIVKCSRNSKVALKLTKPQHSTQINNMSGLSDNFGISQIIPATIWPVKMKSELEPVLLRHTSNRIQHSQYK